MNNFIFVSTGRTGTLSLATAFQKYKNVDSVHERFRRARILSNHRWDERISENNIQKEIVSYYNHNVDKSKLYIEANCLFWNILDVIDKVFKENVFYFYVYREPHATIESMCHTSLYHKSHGTGISWQKRAQRGFKDITSPSYNIEKQMYNCCYAYKIRNEQIAKFLKTIPNDRFCLIKFEEMIKWTNLSKIVDIMNLRSDIKLPRNISLPITHNRRPSKRKHIVYTKHCVKEVIGENFLENLLKDF